MLPQFFGMLTTVMTVWMLIDAVRRRADAYWYFIILAPLGQWIYFFAVKIHDYRGINWKKLLVREPSLNQRERTYEETPSTENRVRLGQALLAAGRFAEASAHFVGVHERDRLDKEALHGLGIARLRGGDAAGAADALQRLVELQPSYLDYEAWFDLALARWQLGHHDAAIEVLERLCLEAPRMKHSAILGRYMMRAGYGELARKVLESALADHASASGYVRRGAAPWARQAKETLREIGSQTAKVAP